MSHRDLYKLQATELGEEFMSAKNNAIETVLYRAEIPGGSIA